MKREPTEEENRRITEAIFAGDRVEATNIYLSITECGLTEAQTFIRQLTSEVKSTAEEKQVSKKRRSGGFWKRMTSSLKG
jgi:ribosomal protein L7/L12